MVLTLGLTSTAAIAAPPIIGGTTAGSGNWPDVGAVLGAQGSCTGTLIAPDVVITAGHCAEVNPTQVKLATTDFNAAGGITATVKRITAYPDWQTTYDVSVIVLSAPVVGVTPRTVATACTYQSGWANGASVHLVGFGATDVLAKDSNSKLYEVSVPLTDAMCVTGNGCKGGVSPDGEFVAGGAGKDSCNGDSGGPVFMDTPRGPILVGAVSRETESATNPCGDGGIYVRTDKVVAWLEQTSGRTIAKDDCRVGSPMDPDPKPAAAGDVVGGCNVGGAGAGLLGVLIAITGLRRRR